LTDVEVTVSGFAFTTEEEIDECVPKK